MTAKHRAPQPKRKRSTDDLEKRVRRIERNYAKDAAHIARSVARVEIGREISQHIQSKHGGWMAQQQAAENPSGRWGNG